jgi:hypothetical protein
MNKLLSREYHEAVGNIVKVDLNKDIALGQALLDRVPYNYIDEQEESFKVVSDDNPLAMTEDELMKLIPKINFNLPDSDIRMAEKMMIEQGNYWDLLELKQQEYPFNMIPKMQLYTYCRALCNKEMSKEEMMRIKADIKFIEKNQKKLKDLKFKKEKGDFWVNF